MIRSYLRVGQWLAISGISAFTGCGSEGFAEGPAEGESVDQQEQAVIPGAAVARLNSVYSVPAGGQITGSVTCPAGSDLIGGGYHSGPSTRTYVSRQNGNGWQVTNMNLSTTSASFVNVVAECLTGTNASSGSASGSKTLSAGAYGCAVAACPAGTVLTGGGFTGSSAFQPVMSAAENSSSWTVCGRNKNTFQSISFQSHAVCLSGVSGGPHLSTVSFTVPAGTNPRVDSQPCPSGQLLSMGGFIYASTANLIPESTYHSFQDSTRWSTWALNIGTYSDTGSHQRVCLELW